jgi:hypothetical protein
MSKRVVFTVCLAAMLAPVGPAAGDFDVFKVDFSCPGQPHTKKGGDWIDFEVGEGCDGDRHNPRWLLNVGGTNIDVGAGQWSGHGNVMSDGGDPICNTRWYMYYGDCVNADIRMVLTELDPETTYLVHTYHAWGGRQYNIGADSGRCRQQHHQYAASGAHRFR